jgi:hypothetical protein
MAPTKGKISEGPFKVKWLKRRVWIENQCDHTRWYEGRLTRKYKANLQELAFAKNVTVWRRANGIDTKP